MIDCFALFKEPRRPWLDPEKLKEKLHQLTAEHHPDVAQDHSIDFTAINSAYRILHDPKSRLRHLLDLEFPDTSSGSLQIPADITRLFETMTRERHSVGEYLKKTEHLTTPLEMALLAPEKLELLRVLEKLLSLLKQKQEGILMQLKFIDAVWDNERPSMTVLMEIYQGISYIGKWVEQLTEDISKMTDPE